jgi:hypothetical protein
MAWKKWDSARVIFERVKGSGDARLSAAADDQLKELQARQKYGIAPQKPAAAPATVSKPSVTPQASTAPQESSAADAEKPAGETKSEAPPPTGPIQFLKGKLVSVDCSRQPGAVLSIVANGKTLHLHTPDYKSLTLIGADTFSCDWQNRQISVNYRPSGKTGGDLVSLEIR